MKQSDANPSFQPLAMRMRPRKLDEYIGQAHLVGPGKPLRRAIEQGTLHSMILWGPPGTGKTTLAYLMAERTHARFVRLSAIFSGVKDIRKVVEESLEAKLENSQSTILFIDEIHRFNKAQQDVFLPYVEDGTFILIGATTENPSFELNSALLSRCRVYVLKSLTEEDLLQMIQVSLGDKERGLGEINFHFPDELQKALITAADGDARQVLNLLEILAGLGEVNGEVNVTAELLSEVMQASLRRFDKQGEAFYDQISALHKSVRGSSPDASLYWLCRMLDGGCDPRYIARRVVRMACEDIGLADPKALEVALNAVETYERLGSPEGELAIAEAVVYLACLPKSNAVYTAYKAAMAVVKSHGSLEVPMHLRNAPTHLMKDLGYGENYRYAHDEEGAYAAGATYLPDKIKNRKFYQPTSRGLEAKISERLKFLQDLDKKSSLRKP
jgi:putative ATPase